MLTLVPTPIGNLGDITLRSLEALHGADVIAAEDTQHTLKLLRHYDIRARLVSYHEHNEEERTPELLRALQDGQQVVLVSDAGMPLVSDPGYRLLHACREADVAYTVLPGASAVITAVAGSGFGGGKFFFAGFLPVKSGGRVRELEAARDRGEITVFFESPHRLLKTLQAAVEVLGDRPLCVARELSKQFEEYRHGTAWELAEHYGQAPARGEICLVVSALTRREAREQCVV